MGRRMLSNPRIRWRRSSTLRIPTYYRLFLIRFDARREYVRRIQARTAAQMAKTGAQMAKTGAELAASAMSAVNFSATTIVGGEDA